VPSNKCNLLIGSSNGVLRIPVNSLTVEQVPYHTRPTIAADAGRPASQVMRQPASPAAWPVLV
jgi:hypothetical protein